MQDASLPLRGIQVLEIGTSVAAPYAGWVLAALGASVTKVERPRRGDDIRYWAHRSGAEPRPCFTPFTGVSALWK